MEKLKMISKDIRQENIETLKLMFPEVIKNEYGEDKIDPELLLQELSSDTVTGSEKYQLSWPGKKDSIIVSNSPTTNTLLPLSDESIDFSTARNVYIKGDNLEGLKILQESYLHKIKVIYIDPPYNRGKDLIYKDNYRSNNNEELSNSEQIDEEGNKLVTNLSSDGKYHSKWLSMMYSRLKLAKNLLTRDGTIFISIDDNEQASLKLLCDEVFGVSSFITSIPRICSYQRSGQEKFMNISHDYILCYSYNEDFNAIIKREVDPSKIKEDKNGKYIPGDTKAIFAALSQGYSKGGDYDFEYNGKIYKPEDSNGNRNRWLWTKERMQAAADLGILVETGRTLRMQLYLDKKFEEGTNKLVDRDDNLKFHTADFMKGKYDNPIGTKELKELFDGKEYFDNPKPVNLIKDLIELASDKNSIILDFFSGSATTAEATIKLNKEDGGQRQFIMIQIEQDLEKTESAYIDGYRTLCDVGIERIRRVIKKYDYKDGFRVYKVDSSNMKDEFYLTPDKISQEQIKLFEDNIKDDRTPEDLLTQVILNLGLKLDLSIKERNMNANRVFDVDDGELLACFDSNVNIDIIEKIAEIKPRQVVFRDSSFATDQDKVNFEERLKRLSAGTKFNVL